MKYNKYFELNKEEILKQIKNHVEMTNDFDDIFIVTKNLNVIFVTNDPKEALRKLHKKELSELSNTTLQNYFFYIKNFVKFTNKYLTYNDKCIYKYFKTLELGNKPDKEKINILNKDAQVQKFLRIRKLERILNYGI